MAGRVAAHAVAKHITSIIKKEQEQSAKVLNMSLYSLQAARAAERKQGIDDYA